MHVNELFGDYCVTLENLFANYIEKEIERKRDYGERIRYGNVDWITWSGVKYDNMLIE